MYAPLIMSVTWGLVQQRGPWHETARDIANRHKVFDSRVGGGTFIGGTIHPKSLRVMNPNTMAPTNTPIGLLKPSNYANRKIISTEVLRRPIQQPVTGRRRLQRIPAGLRPEDRFSISLGDIGVNPDTSMRDGGYLPDFKNPRSIVHTEASTTNGSGSMSMDTGSVYFDEDVIMASDAQSEFMDGLENLDLGRHKSNNFFMSEDPGTTVAQMERTSQQRPSIAGKMQKPNLRIAIPETVNKVVSPVNAAVPNYNVAMYEHVGKEKGAVSENIITSGGFYNKGDTLNLAPGQSSAEQTRAGMKKAAALKKVTKPSFKAPSTSSSNKSSNASARVAKINKKGKALQPKHVTKSFNAGDAVHDLTYVMAGNQRQRSEYLQYVERGGYYPSMYARNRRDSTK